MEVETSTATSEELKAKVKALEQENTAKEQEIRSLTHKNGVLEQDLEKVEAEVKKLKTEVGEMGHHGTQNESLQRRLQILEEEAEESDRNIRETNDK